MTSRPVMGPPDAADVARVGAAVVPLPDPLQVGSGGGGGGPLGRAILARLEAGTLLRHNWTGVDAQGRETACLLAALVPQCGASKDAEACPADVMPSWLAYLTPWISDAGTDAAWEGHVREYADLAPHFGRLTADPALGRLALVGVLRAIVAATRADPKGGVVLALLDRERSGGTVTPDGYTRAAYYTTPGAARHAAHAAYYAYYADAAAAAEAALETAEVVSTYASAEDTDRLISAILAALREVLQVPR